MIDKKCISYTLAPQTVATNNGLLYATALTGDR